MAKDGQATLWLRIKESGSEALSALGDKLDSIRDRAAVMFAVLSAGIAKSIYDFGEEEQAVQKLNRAMINAGTYTEGLSKQYREQASALQLLTGYGDESIVAAQAIIQSQIGNLEVTEELTRATLDLAAAQGMDLSSAAELVGKSIGTSTNALARQGIELQDGLSKSEKLSDVVQKISQKFGGQAEAANHAHAGITRLKNAFSDFSEALGAQFAPVVEKAATWIAKIIEYVKDNQAIVSFFAALIAGGTAIAGAVAGLALLAQGVVALNTAAVTLGISMSAILGPIALVAGAVGLAAAGIGYYVTQTDAGSRSTKKLTKDLEEAERQLASLQRQMEQETNNPANVVPASVKAMYQKRIDAKKKEIEEMKDLALIQQAQEIAAEEDKQRVLLETKRNALAKEREAQTAAQIQRLEDQAAQRELEKGITQAMHEEDMAQLVFNETDKELALNAANQKKMDALIAFHSRQAEQSKSQSDKLANLQKVADLQDQKAAITKTQFELEQDRIREQARADTLSKIASMQDSNNEVLAATGKAAALTQIAIDTPVAVVRALAAFPPPFNYAAAAAVAAAAGAQAARVAGIPLAEGGIVRATPGGVPAIIGEGGQDEAVIPLDRAGEFGFGGGGGVTIVVNGGLLGDPSSAQEFAIAVDRALYDLRKSGNSVAFDRRA